MANKKLLKIEKLTDELLTLLDSYWNHVEEPQGHYDKNGSYHLGKMTQSETITYRCVANSLHQIGQHADDFARYAQSTGADLSITGIED